MGSRKAYDLGQLGELDEIEALHQRMSDILLSANHADQLALINAHPDLAGKAAIQGELTESSTNEQAGAGIHQCTAEEFARFTELNDAYKAKFQFPFIMAVKAATGTRSSPPSKNASTTMPMPNSRKPWRRST